MGSSLNESYDATQVTATPDMVLGWPLVFWRYNGSMSIIRATVTELGKLLGCQPHQTEEVVRSEPSAKLALSRRGLFQGLGAVAASTLVSVPSFETEMEMMIRIARQELRKYYESWLVASLASSFDVAVQHQEGRTLLATVMVKPFGYGGFVPRYTWMSDASDQRSST